MKKFLLSFILLCAVFLGHSQQRFLWFNEIVPDPGSKSNKANNEYIEFYNTSTTAVPLDCYVIVSYFKIGNQEGVYVYNFPSNEAIPGLGYYTISSANAIEHKGGTYTPTNPATYSNWNSPGPGGSILKYTYDKNKPLNERWSAGENVGSNFNDFMTIRNGNDASLLLYEINSNGSTSLINGLFVNQSSNAIPQDVTGLSSLSIAPNPTTGNTSCASGAPTVTLNFGGITTNQVDIFSIQQATGNNNSVAKIGNGICGNWEKVEQGDRFSPGAPNPTAIGTVVPTIPSQQYIVCNGSQLKFRVTGGSSNLFNVIVKAYYDNGTTANVLDVDDTPVPISTTTVTFADINKWFTLPLPNSTQPILLTYQSAQGCYSNVIRPIIETSGALTTSETNVCGNFIDYTVSGTTNSSPNYVLPITVTLFVDANSNGQFESGEEIGQPQTVTNFSTSPQRVLIPAANKNDVILVSYNSAASCYSKFATSRIATSTFAPTERYFCGKRVNFTIPSGSADDVAYSLPIVVSIYYDANENNILDENTSDPAILLGRTTVNSFSNVNNVIELVEANWNKDIIIEYKATQSCFTKVVLNPTEERTGDITLGGEINTVTTDNDPVSTLTYFVVQAATANNAYPLQLNVYEDKNSNKLIDAGESIIATQNLNTPAAPGTSYTVQMPNFRSSAILVAESTVGCSEETEPVVNSQAALPVKLVSFNAKRSKEKVALTWQTAMEVNNSGFDIQRKLANGEWKTIAFMFSKANDGNSNSMLSYEYTDINSAKGVSQYRLRQVDIDTRSTFSEVRSVHGLEQASRLLVYPNPSADGKVSVVFDDQQGSRNIMVSDMAGRVVKQYRNITDNSLQIDNLQNGIYTLKIINVNTGETTVEKLIIKKR